WKRLAKTWPWLISGITPDRDGGLWFEAGDNFTPVSGWADQIIVHQTAKGTVTSVPLRAGLYGLSAARGIVFAMGETSSRRHIWAIRHRETTAISRPRPPRLSAVLGRPAAQAGVVSVETA
ncbi:hypothetical protein, partial [Actinocorallia lasiicapitis]